MAYELVVELSSGHHLVRTYQDQGSAEGAHHDLRERLERDSTGWEFGWGDASVDFKQSAVVAVWVWQKPDRPLAAQDLIAEDKGKGG